MGSVAFQFGDYQFTGTNALISSIDIKSSNRVRVQTIPQKDGAHIEEALLQPLTITIRGTLAGDTQAGLRTVKDDFLNAVCNGTQNLYIWDDRYAVAQKRSLSYDYKSMLKYMPFTVSFLAHSPFWIASTASQDIEQTALSGGTHNYQLDTVGSAYAKPTITITPAAQCTNISFENTTSDEKFGFDGTVLATASLIIDCDAGTVTNSGADGIADFSGDFLSIISGTNTLEYTGGEALITVDWSERWY